MIMVTDKRVLRRLATQEKNCMSADVGVIYSAICYACQDMTTTQSHYLRPNTMSAFLKYLKTQNWRHMASGWLCDPCQGPRTND